jgi:hypothetical protein
MQGKWTLAVSESASKLKGSFVPPLDGLVELVAFDEKDTDEDGDGDGDKEGDGELELVANEG